LATVFHIPTLTLCLAATLIIVSGFHILIWAYERSNRALGFWSLAFSSGALGMILVSLRDIAPPFLALGFGNALGIYSLGLIWMGCLAFEGETRKGAGLIAAAGALVWLCLFAIPAFATDMGTRVLVASVLYAAYSFLAVSVMLRGQRREPLPARIIAILAFSAHGFSYLVRLPLQMIEPVHLDAGHGPLWYGVLTFGFFVQGLIGGLAVFAMVQERATRRYKRASETDVLTSLLNRRAFMDTVGRRRLGFGGSGPGAVLALIDADHFKSINDTHGHGAGDAVLQDLSRLLVRDLPPGTLVGRLGGEEFGIYLPSDVALRHPHLLEELRLAVSTLTIQHDRHLLALTVSIGAVSLPSGVLDFSRALARADKALYQSKRGGRNRVSWASFDTDHDELRDPDNGSALQQAESVIPRSAA